MARHLDTGTDIAALQKADLDDMIVSMRGAGLLPNSINSYMRVLKSFFSWCNEQGLTRLNIPLYKAEETVKETYSDAEPTALLKKPDIRKTTFAEYQDWVIINFLLNCGSRAATVRAIQIRDVDLDGGVVFYRHTKNRKAQVIPLCSPMIAVLREYGRYRGGEPTFARRRVHSSRRTACGNLSQDTTRGAECKRLLFTCSATHLHGNI